MIKIETIIDRLTAINTLEAEVRTALGNYYDAYLDVQIFFEDGKLHEICTHEADTGVMRDFRIH